MGSLSRMPEIARLESCSCCLFLNRSIIPFSQETGLETQPIPFHSNAKRRKRKESVLEEILIIKELTLNVQALTSGRERPQFRSKAYL